MFYVLCHETIPKMFVLFSGRTSVFSLLVNSEASNEVYDGNMCCSCRYVLSVIFCVINVQFCVINVNFCYQCKFVLGVL